MPSPLENAQKIPQPRNSKGVKKNINPPGTPKVQDPFKNSFGVGAAEPMGGAQMDFDMPDMSGMQMNAPEMDFGMGAQPTGMAGYLPGDMAGPGGQEQYPYEPIDWRGKPLEPSDRRPNNWYGKNPPELYPRPEGGTLPPWSGDPVINNMGGAQPTSMSSMRGTRAGDWRNDPEITGQPRRPAPVPMPTEDDPYNTPMMDDSMTLPPMMDDPMMETPMMEDPVMWMDDPYKTPMPEIDYPVMDVQFDPTVGEQIPEGPGWEDPAMGGFQMDDLMPDDMGDPFMGDPLLGQQGQPQGDFPDGGQDEFGENSLLDPYYDKKDASTKWMLEQTAPMTEMQEDITERGWDITKELADKASKKTDKDVVRPGRKPPARRPDISGKSSLSGGQAPSGGDALGGALRGSPADLPVAPSVSEAPAISPPAPAVSLSPTGSPEDKFAGVGDAAYGKADTGSDSKEDVMKPENWDTSGGQYTYKGAEFGKSNTDPPADTDDWEDTRQEAASGAGAASYGTSSSASRSAANEADETVGNWGGSPPPISLPPTQPPVEKPSADKEYYDKLVNPDKFQNAPAINLPPSYGKGKGPGSQSLAGTYQPVGEYDADPDELYDEHGNPLTGPKPIVVEEPGGVLGIRRRGETPAQMRIRRNNAVAQTFQDYNQGIGGGPAAPPGMSAGLAEQAKNIGAQVQQRMAAAQAQLDIPFQYDMDYGNQVLKRRQEKHLEGLAAAEMNKQDYYSYLNNLMQYGDTDNQITQWAAAQMPDAFV